MVKIILEHLYSMVFVTIILWGISALLFSSTNNHSADIVEQEVQKYISIEGIDIHKEFDKKLLIEALALFYPMQDPKTSSVIRSLEDFGSDIMTAEDYTVSHVKEELSLSMFFKLVYMFIQFVATYAVILLLTYYAVETLGTWQFLRKKRSATSMGQKIRSARESKNWLLCAQLSLLLVIKKALWFAAYFILFSPAYVIAYAIKTEFNTDSVLFMVLLALLSNGLVITYTHKFYTFLCAESRKGYVETARVKNLNNSYTIRNNKEFSLRAILHPSKKFRNHVFDHIFTNARFQYTATIKEMATFLITGLIIIEMALNIHGHLSYEMLRQIHYKNYGIAITIMLFIFYAVKLTDMATDIIYFMKRKTYDR